VDIASKDYQRGVNMADYQDLLKHRPESAGGVPDWMWVKSDEGAWEGPKNDWETSHLAMYKKHVKKWDVVVQAGGNCGMYPRLFSDLFRTVYTFEPDGLNFHCLVNNCQRDNVIKFNAALGDVHRMVHLNKGSTNNVGTFTVHGGQVGIIPQMMIDDFAWDELDLIQLDVEGYESCALLGGLQSIRAFKPVIVCERGGKHILDIIGQFGYKEVDMSCADTIYVAE